MRFITVVDVYGSTQVINPKKITRVVKAKENKNATIHIGDSTEVWVDNDTFNWIQSTLMKVPK